MTTLPTGIEGLLGGLNNPKFKNGLLKFLQSPEALALGSGMLAASQPNMNNPTSFGGALAQGLGNMSKSMENSKANEMKERWLQLSEGIQARKVGREARIADGKPAASKKPVISKAEGKPVVAKPVSKARKTMSQKDRMVYAQFIKKYPQYAKDKPEDILAVAKQLGLTGPYDDDVHESEALGDVIEGMQE